MRSFWRHRFVRSLASCALLTSCRAGGHAVRPAAAVPTGTAASGASPEIHRELLKKEDVQGMPGWETRLYLIEYPPGASAPPHVHPAVGVGYVLAGRFESAFEGESASTVEQGQSFVDKAEVVHTLFRNPDPDHPLRFLIAYTIRSGVPTLHPPHDGS